MLYRKNLNSAFQLAREGKTEDALTLLDQFLAQTTEASPANEIVTITGAAGMFAEGLRDYVRAEGYYMRGLAARPNNPLILMSLCSIRKQQGDDAGARSYFERSKEAGISQGDDSTLRTLDELKERWGW